MPEPVKMLSAAECGEIEKRAEATTPGPWRAFTPKGIAGVVAESQGFDCFISLNTRTVEVNDCVERWQRDARFIASAKADVPALLATVRNFAGLLKHVTVMPLNPHTAECWYTMLETKTNCTCKLKERLAAVAAYFTERAADADSQPAVAAPKKEGREE